MNVRTRWFALSLVVLLALALTLTSAFAALTEEQSTNIKGATTVTWDSSFVETEYTVGQPLTVDVDWHVDAGSASFHSFGAKRNTWTPKKDVDGTWSTSGTNPVTLTVTFNKLHYDARRQCLIGNGHFKLYLNIDKDGDGSEESVAGYGVNVHVEQSTNPAAQVCPPDTGGGGGKGGHKKK